jgi:hypothetical protein
MLSADANDLVGEAVTIQSDRKPEPEYMLRLCDYKSNELFRETGSAGVSVMTQSTVPRHTLFRVMNRDVHLTVVLDQHSCIFEVFGAVSHPECRHIMCKFKYLPLQFCFP